MATCECGEVKHPAADACDRCRYLDGDAGSEWLVIAAMRQLGGPASRYEIAEVAGVTPRTVHRVTRALIGVGRVAWGEIDDDNEWQTVRLYWLTEDDGK